MKKAISLLLPLFLATIAIAQPFATWTKTTLTLSNGIVERTIQLPAENKTFSNNIV